MQAKLKFLCFDLQSLIIILHLQVPLLEPFCSIGNRSLVSMNTHILSVIIDVSNLLTVSLVLGSRCKIASDSHLH